MPHLNRSPALLSLPGPHDISRQVLSNDIVVLVRSNFNSPSVSVSGYLSAGSLGDPDEKLGLADFVAAALLRGTQKRSFQEIYASLEGVAASLSFGAYHHMVSFGGHSLAEDLPTLLTLLSESLRYPTFPPEQMERLRAQLLTGLALRAQDTAEMADLTLSQILFDGHPYSRPSEGWPETIQRITREDLAEFHQRYYGPRGLVIAIVGAVEPQQAIAQVEQVLGDWQNPHQMDFPSLPDLKPLTETVLREVKIPDKSQSDLMVGSYGPLRASPEYLTALLANSILGQFGLAGRIGETVREQAGLAYYAFSTLTAGLGPGSWRISAGVNPQKVSKALELIRRELENFVSNGVSEAELADSQSYFIGSLPFWFEQNGSVAASLLNIERFNLGLDYFSRSIDLVRAVRPQDVLEVTRKYFCLDRLAMAIAGP